MKILKVVILINLQKNMSKKLLLMMNDNVRKKQENLKKWHI